MAYHLYVTPSGFADISTRKFDKGEFREYKYLGEFVEKPDVDGKKYVDGKWVWGSSEPEYLYNRRRAYPRAHELLEALWQAMDSGLLPKVPGFYDKMKAAKDRFPEE